MSDLENVTRLEIIDWTNDMKLGGGRNFIIWDKDIALEHQVQDKGRTLKIFVKDRNDN